jgi:GNAT superfamily N-acetyltransferase
VTDAVAYDEKARSYVSIWITVAVVAAGFVVDVIIGGGVAHLPGWILVLATLGGFHFLALYAVRSTRSLTLTADELRVGDDAVDRQQIVGIAADSGPGSDSDEDELPVLGWRNGMPRGSKSVAIRLADGRDVLVPTRFPDRLRTALGLEVAVGPRKGMDVRAAARSEFPLLGEIDERADVIFRTAGYHLPDIPFDVNDLGRAAAVFVAGRPPVGFVQVEVLDGLPYIVELAVVPKWMRQGIGTALLERACEWARAHDYPAITLTTYADVPWNAPYYARHGFVEITEFGPELQAERAAEGRLGLDEVGSRIVMRREL